MIRTAIAICLAIWTAGLARADVAPDAVAKAMRSVVAVLPDWPAGQVNTEEPEGSGVVIGDGRLVLTANHVLGRARGVRLRTGDGDVVAATIAGRDPLTDIALLRMTDPLPPIGEGGKVELAGEVCAIGNSFGLGLSVACGTVSATGRAGVGFNPIEDFIQTDAAVNPGASGGALVDGQGRFVGLLSAIFTKSRDANIEVNFAVSAPLALRAAWMLESDGRATWPSLGLVARALPRSGETGPAMIEVRSVTPGGPAAAAGLAAGDLIRMANGQRLRHPAGLDRIAALADPGSALELTVERDGKAIIVHLATGR